MIFIGFDYTNDEIEWKKIYWNNGEETKYSISNIGLVRNDKKDKILKTYFTKGYEVVDLTHKGKHKNFLVHRLVGIYFIPNPENKPEINHKDGKKYNNCLYNLEWCTGLENMDHAIKNGLRTNSSKRMSLSKEQVEEICKLLEENNLSFTEIAKRVGTHRQSVSRIYNKESYVDISKNFNIEKYEVGRSFSKTGDNSSSTKYSDADIHYVCELIDKGKYSLREIEKMSGIPYQTIRNVYYRTCRRDISKNYNFYKYNGNIFHDEKIKLVKKICKLLDKGYNTRIVSEKLNVPRSLVRNIFSGNNYRTISQNYNFMKKKIKSL